MSPSSIDDVDFLYYCRADGIGFQYTALSRLIHLADRHRVEVLVDWSRLSFFRSRRQRYSFVRLSRDLTITHPALILDEREIGRVLRRRPADVVGIHLGAVRGAPRRRARRIPFLDPMELLPAEEARLGTVGPHLRLEGDAAAMFARHRADAAGSIGVHARLGNAERVRNPVMRDRMEVPPERFFAEMDGLAGERFFVCTDSPSFLQACRDRYGGRVLAMPRSMPPERAGPGHRRGRRWAGRLDGYELFRDALVEMLLLGECRRLICNRSLFTVHARIGCGVDSVILGGEASDYSLFGGSGSPS